MLRTFSCFPVPPHASVAFGVSNRMEAKHDKYASIAQLTNNVVKDIQRLPALVGTAALCTDSKACRVDQRRTEWQPNCIDVIALEKVNVV